MTPEDFRDLTPHSLGEMIQLICTEKNITIAELTTKTGLTGLSGNYLQDVVDNKAIPSLEALNSIAVALEHRLVVSFIETDEKYMPCSGDEIEMLIALRMGDFKRFMLMATAVLIKPELPTAETKGPAGE